MGIGSKIKEYRMAAGLTQKDLADKLFVTYQAVSRWENDDAEPSFEVIKSMCQLFGCTTDDLFDMKKPEPEQIEKKEEPAPQVIEKVIVQEGKPVLGVCHTCSKPIYAADDLNRVVERHRVRHGRSHHTEAREIILCTQCNNKRLQQEAKQKEIAAKHKKEERDKKIKRSFIWSTIIAAVIVTIGILSLTGGEKTGGIILIVAGALSFPMVACCFLDNNCVSYVWLSLSKWSIRFPGVIFTLDLDGIFFLITVKILFGIISLLISILAFLFGTAVAMLLGIFTYPFALVRIFHGKEDPVFL